MDGWLRHRPGGVGLSPSALASRGHGAVDVVGPVAPPGRASGRGYARVYTDRRKWALGAVSGHLCTLLRRDSPRRQPTLTPEEPQKSCKTRDDPRGAPTKGRPSRGGGATIPWAERIEDIANAISNPIGSSFIVSTRRGSSLLQHAREATASCWGYERRQRS